MIKQIISYFSNKKKKNENNKIVRTSIKIFDEALTKYDFRKHWTSDSDVTYIKHTPDYTITIVILKDYDEYPTFSIDIMNTELGISFTKCWYNLKRNIYDNYEFEGISDGKLIEKLDDIFNEYSKSCDISNLKVGKHYRK